MFYNDTAEDRIRFGDVLSGRIMTTPSIKSKDINASVGFWHIEVNTPVYSVVLTPCCTIQKERDNSLLVAPLVQIRPSFLKNPYFVEDFTRINRPIRPENTVSPNVWNDPDYKEKRDIAISRGEAYSLLECFIYEKHDLFPGYELSQKEIESFKTKYYMVDFRKTYRIIWDAIEQNSQEHAVTAKVLELTSETRVELRAKITHFFGRPPEEGK